MLQLPNTQTNAVIETRAYYVWMGSDSIVRILYKKDPPVEIQDIKQQLDHIRELNNGQKALVIGDFSNITRITADINTRRYAGGEDAKQVFKATAIIGASGLTRTLGNIFLTIAQPEYPLKIFATEADAIKWLSQFR